MLSTKTINYLHAPDNKNKQKDVHSMLKSCKTLKQNKFKTSRSKQTKPKTQTFSPDPPPKIATFLQKTRQNFLKLRRPQTSAMEGLTA